MGDGYKESFVDENPYLVYTAEGRAVYTGNPDESYSGGSVEHTLFVDDKVGIAGVYNFFTDEELIKAGQESGSIEAGTFVCVFSNDTPISADNCVLNFEAYGDTYDLNPTFNDGIAFFVMPAFDATIILGQDH